MKKNINNFLSKGVRAIFISSIITTVFFTNIVLADTLTTNQKITLKKSNDINSETLLTIEEGQTIEILNTVDNFTIIKYDDKIGFIETNLLGNTNVPDLSNTTELKVEIVPYDMKNIVYKELYDSIKSTASVKGIEFTESEPVPVPDDDKQNTPDLKTRASKVTFPTWEEAKKVVIVGDDIEVYDVLTGKTYYVRSMSNGNHSDVEPITAKDTEIMFEVFNKKWDWDVRPVWITINGVTIAASINGMPHAQNTNKDNNMEGHVCLHFLGSKTHNGNVSFTKLHQDIAKEAYDYSLEYRK